jgi:cytosine/adenosine deaminase-related metal-dependent hydrolase
MLLAFLISSLRRNNSFMPQVSRRTIIKGANIITMDAERRIFSPGIIIVENDKISDVMAGEEYPDIESEGVQRRVINANGMLALPGLINTHTHVSEILLRGGLSQDRSLYDWQWNITYPGVRAYQERDAYVAALLYSLDALKFGTTTFIDNANTSFNVDLINAALRAYKLAGVRVTLARIIAAGPIQDDSLLRLAESLQKGHNRMSPESSLEDLAEVSALLKDLMESHNLSPQSKVRVWPAPHKPNRTSLRSIEVSYELAMRYGAMVSQPCSEIEAESHVGGLSSVEYLYRHGLLCDRTLLGHCVHVSHADLEMIKSKDARVAHLPVANLYLGSGIAPVAAMLSAGITVGLGTDNANCNDSVNMFREMSIASLIHKVVAKDARAITAEQVFKMATIDAARAIGEDARIGSIEPGKQADIVLIDLQAIHLTPLHDLIAGVIHQANGSEVDTVIVDGELLVEKGAITFMTKEEEAELRREAQRRSSEIIARARLSLN